MVLSQVSLELVAPYYDKPNTEIEKIRRILSDAKISHTECVVRDGYYMFQAAVPGQRWEIEITPDGEIEYEVFRSNGEILDREAFLDAVASVSES